MKRIYNHIIKFFTEDIWKEEFTNDVDQHWCKIPLAWLKTFLVACRIIWKKDMLALHLPALTFSTLMAIVPVFALLFVVARGFGYDEVVETWIGQLFAAQPVVADVMMDFVKNYLANTKSNYIIGIGVVMMVYTLFSLMQKIEKVFNWVWKARERKILEMLTEYTTIFIFFGVMVLFSSFLNICSTNLIQGIEKFLGIGDYASLLLRNVAIIPMSIFFITLYCAIPNTYVKIKNSIVPGIIAGIMMTTLQYYYFMAQVWLASYNIIYGSFAALPLFLLWLQLSWAICLFGATLTYANQNLHHFDLDAKFKYLGHEKQMEICAVVLGHICRRFANGEGEFTPRELQNVTKMPQQIINSAIRRLLVAGLIEELKNEQRGVGEVTSKFHPFTESSKISYATLVCALEKTDEELDMKYKDPDSYSNWDKIRRIQTEYLSKLKDINVQDL